MINEYVAFAFLYGIAKSRTIVSVVQRIVWRNPFMWFAFIYNFFKLFTHIVIRIVRISIKTLFFSDLNLIYLFFQVSQRIFTGTTITADMSPVKSRKRRFSWKNKYTRLSFEIIVLFSICSNNENLISKFLRYALKYNLQEIINTPLTIVSKGLYKNRKCVSAS